MTHALIIRFHYKVDDPRFEWRYQYFKRTVLPRILEQSYSNFDICIWCNPEHDTLFKVLHKRIKVFHVKGDRQNYKQINGKRYFYDFASWEDVENLEKYDIQTGIDSDDLISKDFIKEIERLVYVHKCAGNGDKKLHISFQPELFIWKTGKTERITQRYHKKKGSAFLSLYQPNKNDYVFLYCDSHLRMWKYADESITVPSGFCWATVHEINESTGV
jgi:hypothetical protein